MRKLIILFYVLLGMMSLGCSAFLEKSISNSHVVLDAPGDNVVIGSYNITFHWEPVPNALTYELQVVSPSFDSTQYFLVDSTIKSNQYVMTLKPGMFSWRVRALNGSSNTNYTKFSFKIDTASFANQVILLSSPVSGTYTNISTIALSWQGLYGATKYEIQIDTSNFSLPAQAAVFLSGTNSISFIPVREGVYFWKVRGVQAEGNSHFSGVQSFTYDKTPPASPKLITPATPTKVTMPDTLTWSKVSDAFRYKIYLYKGDSTTSYSSSFPAISFVNNFIFNSGIRGEKIYWTISAIDKAGNESNKSAMNYFTVGP